MINKFVLLLIFVRFFNSCRSQAKSPVLALNSLEFMDIFDTAVGLAIEQGRFFIQCEKAGEEVRLNITAKSRQGAGELSYPKAVSQGAEAPEPTSSKFWVTIDESTPAFTDYHCQNVEGGQYGSLSARGLFLGYKLCGFGSPECHKSRPCKAGTYCVKLSASSNQAEECLSGTAFKELCSQTLPPEKDIMYVACRGGQGTTMCHQPVHSLVSTLEYGAFCDKDADDAAYVTFGDPNTATGDILRLIHHTPLVVSLRCGILNALEKNSKNFTQSAGCDLRVQDPQGDKAFTFNTLGCKAGSSASLRIEASKHFDPKEFGFAKIECRWGRLVPSPDHDKEQRASESPLGIVTPQPHAINAARYSYRYISYMSGKAAIRFGRTKCEAGAGVMLECLLAKPLPQNSPFMVTEIRFLLYKKLLSRQKEKPKAILKAMKAGVYTCELTVRFRVCAPFFEYSQNFSAPNDIRINVAESTQKSTASYFTKLFLTTFTGCLPLNETSGRYRTTTEEGDETTTRMVITTPKGNDTGEGIKIPFFRDATKMQWIMVGSGGVGCVVIISIFVAILIRSRNKKKKVVKMPPKIQSRYGTQREFPRIECKKLSSKMASNKMSSKMKQFSRMPTKRGRTYGGYGGPPPPY